MSTARKPAQRLPRPAARYWKGKAPKGADAPDSDSDYDEDAEVQPQEAGDVPIEDVEDDEDGLAVRAGAEAPRPKAINVALRDVNISKEGRVIVAGKVESGRTDIEMEEEEEEEEEAQGADAEEESSEYESESEEEEEKPKLQFRPVFVPKRGRVTVAEREAIAEDTEEALQKKAVEADERKKQSHDMVADSIRRELAQKEKDEEVPDIDDTDGLDSASEFEAWRLRELARIKRDKEQELQRELEREEVERRRALPEAQRLQEDMARAEQSRSEKPKGQQKFLQKYWHKGAFHQDEEILQRHDFTEATESTVDVSVLPKVMQVKNFGKRSRTKYTHLLDQDTTVASGGFGGTAPVKAGGTSTAGGGCFLCGGPHLKKDCPQNRDLPPGRMGTGANTAAVGSRQWGARDGPTEDGRKSWRDRDDDTGRPRGDERDRRRPDDRHDADNGRDRSDGHERRGGGGRERDGAGEKEPGVNRERRRRSYSRSRSPVRDRWRESDRRRSRERSVDHDRGDKRRRVDY
ncbi:splicing factor, Prp19-binding domain-containing protein [Amylocystis lapponica]|nr:splicing factor, Prp19-binding domain-containing protein [Amylocystis lapponica]